MSPCAGRTNSSNAASIGKARALSASARAARVTVRVIVGAIVGVHSVRPFITVTSTVMVSLSITSTAAAHAARTPAGHPLAQAHRGSGIVLLFTPAAVIRSPPFPVPTDTLNHPPPVLFSMVVADGWRGAVSGGMMGGVATHVRAASAYACVRKGALERLRVAATRLTSSTAMVQAGMSSVTMVNGCVGWRAGSSTVSLALVGIPTESRQPSRATIAPRPTCGAAMSPIGATLNRTHTQHRPQTRCEPRTGAPWHTPRTLPPGTPTDVHRKVGPGGPHTHSDEDENGHVRCTCMWFYMVPVVRVQMVTSGIKWRLMVMCGVGVHACSSMYLGIPFPSRNPPRASSPTRAILLPVTSPNSISASAPLDLPPSRAAVCVRTSIGGSRDVRTHTSGCAVGVNDVSIWGTGYSGVPALNIAGSIFGRTPGHSFVTISR